MGRFLVIRTLTGLFVLWLITIAVFVLFFVAPSNVARTLAGRQATPQTIALINHRLCLDRPWWRQYLDFLDNALHGNLGYDYYHQQPVTTIIREAFPITFSLAVGAAIIWLVLGVYNGVVSATHPRSLRDRTLTVTSLVFYSMP
jgi:peptide/nickel transport system permease protein